MTTTTTMKATNLTLYCIIVLINLSWCTCWSTYPHQHRHHDHYRQQRTRARRPIQQNLDTFYDHEPIKQQRTCVAPSSRDNSRPSIPRRTRQEFLHICLQTVSIPFLATPAKALAAETSSPSSSSDLFQQIVQARKQLDPVPKLIEDQKWDSVRAILIESPLADCWAKTNRPLLTKYAEAVGDAGGDELSALEAKEELVSHLRYLDMAVYNNVFNPIATEGQSGATKELIRSYYEDPINEFRASQRALEDLIALAGGLGL